MGALRRTKDKMMCSQTNIVMNQLLFGDIPLERFRKDTRLGGIVPAKEDQFLMNASVLLQRSVPLKMLMFDFRDECFFR